LKNVITNKGLGRKTRLFVTYKIIVKMLFFFKEYLPYRGLPSGWLHSMTSSTDIS